MTSPDRVTIRRLVATYLVARDHPTPETVQQRLDAALAGVGPWLGAALGRHRDEGIWLVRRIDLDLMLDADVDTDQLARRCAGGLAKAIVRKLDRSADGVVFFADRSAYLARFLADLAAGSAWSMWYYEAFNGLKALPVAMALRTAILADPDRGRRALAGLDRADLARVLEALSPAEALRVLDGLDTGDDDDALPHLVAHLETAGWPPVSPACAERLGLALFVAAMGDSQSATSAAFARAAALLRHHLVLGHDLAGALARGDASALVQVSDALQPLLGIPADLRARLARAVRPTTSEPSTVRFTPLGGPFLLLRLLDELPLETVAGWPDAAGAPATGLVRALVLAKCVGRNRALAFFLDPVWRDLLGLPADLLPTAIARWAPQVIAAHRSALRRALPQLPRSDRETAAFLALPPALRPNRALDRLLTLAARHLFARFADHLPGFAGSSPAYLARNLLDVHARLESMDDGLLVTLSRPPLDVILAMTGLARATLEAPWLHPPRLELRREG